MTMRFSLTMGVIWFDYQVQSDFAFCPFGAGPRKCIGDQFAFFEAVSLLAKVSQQAGEQGLRRAWLEECLA